MKKFLFIALCLAFVVRLHAQLVDTTTHYTWSNSQWLLHDDVNYTYDANCYLVSALYRDWDATLNSWQDANLISYTNNSNGTPQQVLYQGWDVTANAWVNQQRFTYTYNSSSKVLTTLSEMWVTNAWQNSGLITNTYDQNSDLDSTLTQGWTGNWENISLTTYTNNSDGTVSETLTQLWVSNAWTNSSRTTYSFNAAGKVSTQLTESWIANAWQNASQTLYTYDANNNLTILLNQGWDATLNNWLNIAQTTNSYNADRTINEEVVQLWNITIGAWENSTKSDYSYTACSLPLTLLNFNVVKQGSNAILRWQTANEINTSYFGIERSFNGTSFTAVGKVSAQGSGKAENDYSYKDDVAGFSAGKIYYRLKMTDNDGSSKYSPVRAINSLNAFSFSISPNPVKNNALTLSIYNDEAAPIQLSIYSLQGKIIFSQQFTAAAGNISKQIGINNIARGTYIIRVGNGSVVQTAKLVKE